MAASIITYLIPVFVLGGLLLLLGVVIVLGRVRGGKYLKPILMALQKVPFMERWMKRASRAALEKQNPELASAIGKLERVGSLNDPLQAQRAMSKLTSAERRRLERARKRSR